MNKYELIKKIENFAPIENAEPWDCVGFMVETKKIDIKKVMLCLTITKSIIKQAKIQNCDMIISHHPLFFIPLDWSGIDIYSAHTNLDKANGGTTDTIIKTLGFEKFLKPISHDFLRIIEFDKPISILELNKKLSTISPNARLINNNNVENVKKIAFCAGSGAEFINEAQSLGADCFISGDLKFHTALDSEIVIYDIGHFEAEILILPVIKQILGNEIEIVFASEKSPFSQI